MTRHTELSSVAWRTRWGWLRNRWRAVAPLVRWALAILWRKPSIFVKRAGGAGLAAEVTVVVDRAFAENKVLCTVRPCPSRPLQAVALGA
jgi:hypothetical protein